MALGLTDAFLNSLGCTLLLGTQLEDREGLVLKEGPTDGLAEGSLLKLGRLLGTNVGTCDILGFLLGIADGSNDDEGE